MKKITMKLKLLILFLLSILFTGCPWDCDSDTFWEEHGLLIVNYPEWCFGEVYTNSSFPENYYCYGYSDWKDWNSSNGNQICSLVDEYLAPGDYDFDGKYRLLAINQYLYVCFNDRKMTYIQLQNYYGDYGETKDHRISVKQATNDVFEYDANLRGDSRSALYDKKTRVRLEKVSETQFKYNLEVDGNLYVSETMTNYKAEYGSANFSKKIAEYEWLPKNGISFDIHSRNNVYFETTEKSLSIDRTVGFYPDEQLMYCFEGISLRAIDEENKIVSYNFLDAGKNGHCDYFEIKIDSFDDIAEEYALYKYNGTLTFYKIENETPIVVYGYKSDSNITIPADFNKDSVRFF